MKKIYKFLSGFLAAATVLNFSNSTISLASSVPPGKGTGDVGVISEETLKEHATHFNPDDIPDIGMVSPDLYDPNVNYEDVILYDSARETLNTQEYKYLFKMGIACPSYMDGEKIDESIEDDDKIFKLPLKELTGSVYNILTFLYHSNDVPRSDPNYFGHEKAVYEMSLDVNNIKFNDFSYDRFVYPVFGWDTYLVENPKFIEIYGEPKSGDINIDGEITTDDALIVLNHVVGNECLTYKKIEQSDVDSDGEFTTNDALKILETVVGIK